MRKDKKATKRHTDQAPTKADAGDATYDSALLIVADSVQSALIAQDDSFSVTGFGHVTRDLIANDTTAGRTGVHISAINDIAVTAGSVVTLNSGDAVRLEADGRVTVLSAGINGPVTFSHTITDAAGVSDSAFVTFDPLAVDGTAFPGCAAKPDRWCGWHGRGDLWLWRQRQDLCRRRR